MIVHKFILEYAAAYARLQLELHGHTGQCKSEECAAYGRGLKAAFDMLPKPPGSRKNRRIKP